MVKLLDQAVFFKKRDKNSRADRPQPGMLPTHQRLGAGELGALRTYVKLRLVMDQELPVGDGLPEIFDELFCVKLPLVERIVI